MDEGRKRVIGIIAGIIMARNLDRADDLFGGPQRVREPIQLIAKSESFMGITFPKGCKFYAKAIPYAETSGTSASIQAIADRTTIGGSQ